MFALLACLFPRPRLRAPRSVKDLAPTAFVLCWPDYKMGARDHRSGERVSVRWAPDHPCPSLCTWGRRETCPHMAGAGLSMGHPRSLTLCTGAAGCNPIVPVSSGAPGRKSARAITSGHRGGRGPACLLLVSDLLLSAVYGRRPAPDADGASKHVSAFSDDVRTVSFVVSNGRRPRK